MHLQIVPVASFAGGDGLGQLVVRSGDFDGRAPGRSDAASLRKHHRRGPARRTFASAQVAPAGACCRRVGVSGRPQIDTLVFGTSIAKPIHAGLFGGPNFFNASVTGGRIEEMIMADQLALDCGLKPRHVLIEIERGRSTRGTDVPDSKLLRRALGRLICPSHQSVTRFCSFCGGGRSRRGDGRPGEGVESVLSLRRIAFAALFPVHDGLLARRWMARGDKSRNWSRSSASRTNRCCIPTARSNGGTSAAQTPENIRQTFALSPPSGLAGLDQRPLADKSRMYEAFVGDLSAFGSRRAIFALAAEPLDIRAGSTGGSCRRRELSSVETERDIRSLAAKHNVPVTGSLDPQRLGVTETDYIDDVHLRREAIDRIFHANR